MLAGNMLAEKVLGGRDGTFEQMVVKRLLQPLNMTSSLFLSAALNTNARMVRSYEAPMSAPVSVFGTGWLTPAGGLVSTPRDMDRMLQQILLGANGEQPAAADGVSDRLFAPLTVAQARLLYQDMLKLQFIDASQKSGFASPFETALRGSDDIMYTKNGFLFGYSSETLIAPSLRLTASLFVNSAGVDVLSTTVLLVEKLAPLIKAKYLETRAPLGTVSPKSPIAGVYSLNGGPVTDNSTYRVVVQVTSAGAAYASLLTVGVPGTVPAVQRLAERLDAFAEPVLDGISLLQLRSRPAVGVMPCLRDDGAAADEVFYFYHLDGDKTQPVVKLMIPGKFGKQLVFIPAKK